MPQLCLLEIDPFGDRQALEMAAEAVESELDGAETAPVTAPDHAGTAGNALAPRRDRHADGAAELDAVGPLVEIDQDRERMARSRCRAQRPRRGLRGFLRDLGIGGVRP